jgi:hypothetical protein
MCRRYAGARKCRGQWIVRTRRRRTRLRPYLDLVAVTFFPIVLAAAQTFRCRRLASVSTQIRFLHDVGNVHAVTCGNARMDNTYIANCRTEVAIKHGLCDMNRFPW